MNNLTPEQIEQNAAAYVAAMNGRPVERKNNDGSWSLEKNPVNTWYMGTVCRRPAPEPEPPKPWDFNSRPLSTVWVYRKGHITDCMIVTWGDDCVLIATKSGIEKVMYDALLRDWLQRDGSPCGIVKEVK